MRRNPGILTIMLCAAGIFVASDASAERGQFRGAHPIPAEHAGTFCYIEAAHTHTYIPEGEGAGQFVAHKGAGGVQFEFVGDPLVSGYEGPLVAYGETHPVQLRDGDGDEQRLCEIEGNHFHLHDPNDWSQFESHKGTFYFGSYKAAMQETQERDRRKVVAERERKKLERAQEREVRAQEREELAQARQAERAQKKEERAQKREEVRLANEARRAERSAEGGQPRASRRKSTTQSRTTAATQPAAKSSRARPRPRPSAKKTKKKPSKKAFRSWMSRRRGK